MRTAATGRAATSRASGLRPGRPGRSTGGPIGATRRRRESPVGYLAEPPCNGVGARVIAGDRSPDACLAARLRMDITAGGEPAETIPRPALDI